jgi:hypothetical protein
VGEKRVRRRRKKQDTAKLLPLTEFESRYRPGMTWRDLVQAWLPGADRRLADRVLFEATGWPVTRGLSVIEGRLVAIARMDWQHRFDGG